MTRFGYRLSFAVVLAGMLVMGCVASSEPQSGPELIKPQDSESQPTPKPIKPRDSGIYVPSLNPYNLTAEHYKILEQGISKPVGIRQPPTPQDYIYTPRSADFWEEYNQRQMLDRLDAINRRLGEREYSTRMSTLMEREQQEEAIREAVRKELRRQEYYRGY